MQISIIVAMGKNQVIGKDGALPWNISSDLKNFKKITMGKPILMGRKTHESIGKPLPGRENIILTKNRNHHWFFIHELSKVLDIKCIIIENKPNQSLFKKIQKHGFRWTILKAISKISSNTTNKIDKQFLKFQNTFDPEKTKAKFQELVLDTSDINSKKVKEKLKSISPRYLCSLGGGIIDSEGISYADLALNFHVLLKTFYYLYILLHLQ